MGKKILGFILFLTIGGFALLFTLRKEHKLVMKFPEHLIRINMIKLYVGNLVMLLINVMFWLIVIALWR